jgi:hypothetical protein
MKIIILGGYGVFGGRLCQLLASDARLTIHVAGRSYKEAQDFCSTLVGVAHFSPLEFDRHKHSEHLLQQIQPDLLIDATGPFQNYGSNPYQLVRACLAYGINYMDFADGSEFVNGIGQFDEEAQAKNIFILSGVSSFPVLTAAVIRHLSNDWKKVNSIKAGIAPSPYAVVGLNVIRAISAYAGQPISLIRGGKPTHGYALTETMRYTISPPGMRPLNNIRFALVDVPDLKVLPTLWPDLNAIWMGAGPVPEFLLRMLNGMAWLVRLKILPSLSVFAPIFYYVISTVRWGEHRGGMFVEIEGIDKDDSTAIRSWHLLAEGDDGPYIPCMALQAIVMRTLNGDAPKIGSRAASGDLELSDYEPLFAKRTIYTGRREDGAHGSPTSVFRSALGNAWDALPDPIRQMHDLPDETKLSGHAQIRRGKNLPARFIATIFNFPDEADHAPVTVSIRKKLDTENWSRNFNGKIFDSEITSGAGPDQHLICERFGPFTFSIALVLENGRLNYVVRKGRFLSIPMPRFLIPGGDSFESAENGQFHFSVEITYPLVGLVVSYRGVLESDQTVSS